MGMVVRSIPTLDAPKVGEERAPGVRVQNLMRKEDFVGNVPEVLDRVGDRLYKRAQQSRVNEAYAELGAARFQIEDEASKQSGADALKGDLAGQALEQYQKEQDRILKDIGDTEVRAAVEAQALKERAGLERRVHDHVQTQEKVVAKTSFEAGSKVAIDKGIRAAGTDPTAKMDLLALTNGFLRGQGFDPDSSDPKVQAVVQATRLERLTEYHLGVAETLNEAVGAAAALEWANRNAPEMDPEALTKLRKTLKGPAAVEEAVGAVQAIEKLYPGDEAVQLAKVQEEPGSKGAKMLEVWRERAATRKAVRNEGFDANLGMVFNGVEKKAIRNVSDLERFTPFTLLDEGRQARARRYLDDANGASRARTAGARAAQRETDAEALADYEELWQTDPKAASEADVKVRYGGAVSKDGLLALRRRQTRAKGDFDKDQGVSEGAFRTTVLQLAGTSVKPAKQKAFLQRMTQRRMEWLEQDGNATKTPPKDEVARWVAETVRWGDAAGDAGGSMFSTDRQEFDREEGRKWAPFPEDRQPKDARAADRAPEREVAPPVPPAGKVRVVGPENQVGWANEAGLEEWFKSPTGNGWRRAK